jgi:hypothetical protein
MTLGYTSPVRSAERIKNQRLKVGPSLQKQGGL